MIEGIKIGDLYQRKTPPYHLAKVEDNSSKYRDEVILKVIITTWNQELGCYIHCRESYLNQMYEKL